MLDFGLAKALAPEPMSGEGADQDLSLSPTLTHAMTGIGVLLGTAGYMSPEQARGKPVDRRADIWAFGCILYEMLTGERLFSGETATDVIGAATRKALATARGEHCRSPRSDRSRRSHRVDLQSSSGRRPPVPNPWQSAGDS